MRRNLITASILFCIATNFVNATDLEKEEKVIIEKLITKILKQQNSLKNNGKVSNKKDFLEDMPKYILYAGRKYNTQEYIEETSNSYLNMKNDGIKIIKSSFEIQKIDCMYLEDESVDCYVKEIIKTTSAPESDLSYIVKGQENINIKFNLKRDDDYQWFVEEEKIFGFGITSSDITENSATLEQEVPIEVDDSSPRININELKNNKNKSDLKTEAKSGYNGSSAAAYARYYALNYNSAYRSFSNDCTNFVSQSVKYGGWAYDGGWYRDSHNWWYSSANQTWTWAGAHNFWWFNHYHNRSHTVSSTCSLQLGDIISADWTKDGHVDHSMVVTLKSGCSVWLSYHSSDTLNKPFSSLPSDASYWGWHITGTNN